MVGVLVGSAVKAEGYCCWYGTHLVRVVNLQSIVDGVPLLRTAPCARCSFSCRENLLERSSEANSIKNSYMLKLDMDGGVLLLFPLPVMKPVVERMAPLAIIFEASTPRRRILKRVRGSSQRFSYMETAENASNAFALCNPYRSE